MVNVSKIWLTLAIICTILFGALATTRIVNDVQFDYGCGIYLKRAADANSVEMAKDELAKAISFAEQKGLTEGNTGIIFKNPKNDVGFWYDNMKACYQELEDLPEDVTSLEKTNVLMKLRESLLDTGESTSVTLPSYISIYPNNLLYALWGWISLISAVIFWVAFGVTKDY